ncbi:MAG: aspartate kinase, partial [Lachnospiraceae bacterium]|nr:aspartate kinase [Lachnospiraceae bacterium]
MKKVVKFGGSSLADATQFKKVAAIIRDDPTRLYVVPSAPGKRFSGDEKVTDLLYRCYDKAAAGEDFRPTLSMIRGRYDDIIVGLGLKNFTLEPDFAEIEKSLAENPERDYTASRGEYLNSKIMAEFIGFEFVDAADVVVFDEDGGLSLRRTNKAMANRLQNLEHVVIPGFYGRGVDGKIKTFSRGGSDITGSIVAGAMKVDVYENWTDVSGFLVADPRIVENPVAINTITYRELRELSYMGAAVLHEDAIFPVRRSGIPINIRNTNRPEDKGTWIVESTAQKSGYTITGIAGKKGFCAVLISKAMMNSEIGFGRKVLQAFEENN